MTRREELLARSRERRQAKGAPVPVPGWDEPVFVRILGAQEAQDLLEDVKPRDIPYVTIVATICDADGSLIFEPGDEAAIAEFTHAEVKAMFLASQKRNGLGAQAVDDAVADFTQPQGASTSTE